MADLGSFEAPERKDPREHTITVCGEQFTVKPRFTALQSVQWAKAIRKDDGMAIGSYTAEILSASMDKETYGRFEEIVEQHEVDLNTLAQIADALMTAALSNGGEDERPTTKPSDSSSSQKRTSRRSKGVSSLPDTREARLRARGMVPIMESEYLRSSG